MVRNFHPERTDPRGLQKNQRALEALLERLFDRASGDELFVVLAGRSGGQTILQGVTLEGGVVVNDLDVDVDFLVKALGGVVGINVDGASGFVSIGTATPATELYVVGVVRVKGKVGNAVFDLETADGTQLWRHQNTQGSGLYVFRDATNGLNCLSILPNTPTNTLRLAPSGAALFGSGSFGGGAGVLFIGNRTTAPSSNPSGGGILSIDAGVPKYIGPTGSESVVLTGADNLASLVSAATARTNLGLLSAALRDVGVGSDSEIPDRGLADARYAAVGHDHDADYAPIGALSAPSGVRLLLGNNSVPSGWAIVASLADRTIMLTSTASEIDDLGGSWTTGITATTNVLGHNLTVAELAVHTHNVPVEGGGGLATAITVAGSRAATGDVVSESAGSGSAHSHGANTAINSSSYRPAYYKAAFVQRSA